MSWFQKLVPSTIRTENSNKKGAVPEGLWNKCPNCNAILYNLELERNLHVCPKCEHHMRISARTRLDIFLDEEGREEIGKGIKPTDPLKFRDSKKYKDRLSQAQKQTKESDALVVMKGKLKGADIVAAADLVLDTRNDSPGPPRPSLASTAASPADSGAVDGSTSRWTRQESSSPSRRSTPRSPRS